ncbi:P-loop containing nucleoside triphosphate hydrolase protein [Radiomyces spectabilis]|uniref:P-loop containing nucleoside triphosphate hydrolase protein n=1 Tax=Radiomyces spectabilis TaxID=64574 RepID=UPI00221F2981|nr:P-loop containing nucleoside triphosphate hydrolase protein [Radiomyces spectabilis]KAI8379662.1 P-loop containing nucleoside triphosphate hydrolase protein [Radiomyces spectabilis]
MNRARGGGQYSRLSRSLEFKISRHLTDYKNAGNTDWSLFALYDYVQRVDVSLRRVKKRQIEMVIEKVLPNFETMAEEQPDSTTVSTDEEGEYALVSGRNAAWLSRYLPASIMQDANPTPKPAQDNNAMNKSVTGLWNLQKASAESPSSVVATPGTSAANTPVTEDMPALPTEDKPDEKSEEKPETRTKKRSKARDGASSTKRAKTEGRDAPFIPSARLSDLGGIDHCVEEIMELIAMPLAHPEVYIHTGVQPPRGVLLHGPPGCGKTKLAHAIAGELNIPFINISAPSIVSGMSGESEKKIRDVFEEARSNAPCLLFIDEIDAITPKRETAQREMERRIVAQLLTCMDDLSWDKTDNKPVMIIGATNRPDSLDPALRRAGRFDREISMGVPDDKAREKILTVLAAKLRLEGTFDFGGLAKATPGYVGADLQALITTAGVIAVKRIFKHLRTAIEAPPPPAPVVNENSMDVDETKVDGMDASPIQTTSVEEFENQSALEQLRSISDFIQAHKEPLSPAQLESLAITQEDFQHALKKVQPSSKREGFATVPDVTWEDIGALSFVRDELRMAVVEPINHPEFFERVGISSPAGVLLWGPPGCGKTLLAKAVANESNTNFISVKGPELLNKYVGESERGVRQVFARARASAPCVIFFDELDALCSRRDDQQTDSSARVVNTLLTELDGVENRAQVYVIAATNRPDMIDPAMLRPGRLDKLLYVELPTPGERLDILTKLTKNTPLAADISLEEVANDSRCEGFSGADLASLVRESAVSALRNTFYRGGIAATGVDASVKEVYVKKENFDTAFSKVSPSVLPQDKLAYDRLRKKFG